MTTKNYYELIKSKCVEDSATGCWNWQNAQHPQGYGLMRHHGTMKTIQRIMAIERLGWELDFKSRIGNTCQNVLCANPNHIINQTHSEVNFRRYRTHGNGGQFENKEREIKKEYDELEGTFRRVPKLAAKYGCATSAIYRAIEKGKWI